MTIPRLPKIASPPSRLLAANKSVSRKLFLLGAVLLSSLFTAPLFSQPSGLRVVPASGRTSQITSHAITWYFDSEVEFGQFANGDYWVIGPVTILDIDPLSVVGTDDWTVNGSMINPHSGVTQGYDSMPSAGRFEAANNVGRPNGQTLSSSNPLVIEPGNSLVSSRSASTPNNWPQITDASVLTVVGSAPPPGSFRPPYTDTSKAFRWNTADIRWEWLKSVQVARARMPSLPDLESLAGGVERVWLDHSRTWSFTRFHPSNNMPRYGRDIAKRSGDAVLSLLLDYPMSDLESLLIGVTQVGIDLFGLAETGQTWGADGAIYLGRKLLILFAGMLFDDEAMLEYSRGSDHFIFQEDQQTNYVSQALVDVSQSGLISAGGCWNPDTRGDPNVPYTDGTGGTVNMLGWPEWGIRFSAWTENQCSAGTWAPDAAWSTTYRMINSAGTTGHALAAIMMGARSLWDWEPFFEYHDRFVQAGRDGDHTRWKRSGGTNSVTGLVYDMWEEFRADYGSVWVE